MIFKENRYKLFFYTELIQRPAVKGYEFYKNTLKNQLLGFASLITKSDSQTDLKHATDSLT